MKTGSILGLVFGALSLFIGGGEFLIGFITGFMFSLTGGILGLTWKPEQSSTSRNK